MAEINSVISLFSLSFSLSLFILDFDFLFSISAHMMGLMRLMRRMISDDIYRLKNFR